MFVVPAITKVAKKLSGRFRTKQTVKLQNVS